MAANPYQTLGVDPKSNQDEIKSAYRKLAKKLHPDLNPGNKNAESRFKEVASAYDQIGSADDRAMFDRGEAEAVSDRQNSARSRRPFYSETQSKGGRYTNQFEGINDDTLRSFFEQMGQTREGGLKRPPEDQVYKMDIDFKDSILGGEKEITFPSGKKLLVKIPSAVNSGTKLRFAGQGDPIFQDGPAGDIYVELNVKSSPVFKRVGKNLESEITVSFSDAILESEIKVPTINGTILMKIPAKVKSDQRVRLKGKGVLDPSTKTRGDQIVILKMIMPENVDDEFKKAVEDWNRRQIKENI